MNNLEIKNNALNRVKEHYMYLLANYPERSILGVFLYGSQNYNLATENSDVDTKAIYIPTFEEISLNKTPISKELHIKGEHCELKDIRLMWQMWKKQNMNFVECLFTNCVKLNPNYETLYFSTIFPHRDEIARYDEKAAILSTIYQTEHTIRQIKMEESDKIGKKLANGYRLVNFCESFYIDCYNDFNSNYGYTMELRGILRQQLLSLKNNTNLSEEEVNNHKQNILTRCETIKRFLDNDEFFKSKIEQNKVKQAKLDAIMGEEISKIIFTRNEFDVKKYIMEGFVDVS